MSVLRHCSTSQAIGAEGFEEAFRWIKKPFTPVGRTGGNLAGPDLIVEDRKVSLKTETGLGTHSELISITKLCTTERDPWEAKSLIKRVLAHLSKYDMILMASDLGASADSLPTVGDRR